MKKITFLFVMLSLSLGFSQTVINFDATAFSPDPTGVGLGYMNVFDNPKNGSVGGYLFGSSWGIPDLIVELNTGSNTMTLKPNRIGDPDPYWQTTGELEGNKIMDANCYIQDDALVGTNFSFTGNVVSSTLDGSSLSIDFVKIAFIKVYSADYSSVLIEETVSLDTTGDFTLSVDATTVPGDSHAQYGFQVVGPNINSDASFDTAYANLGSVIVQPASLSINEVSLTSFKVFPNPTTGSWTIDSNDTITSIEVFDILGKQVLELNPNSKNVAIEAGNLVDGVYLAKINSSKESKTIKLIKN
ncbi:T9SS type A sorting domain-containing protein [Winogradskyella sp. SYSU M77433]|uniref:T9SS type A sorting domain-containing protein n=1 Tax=Winogradskyella sp. SYSU M77433 TaxID=3042722 RepID=UPI0024806DE7|nr:T9SS type A sorting domain-containing protein [Winogradskyella sp. SYSU M77433]MDH7911655.1 T9SS type A sorting domain-containing protein [Winogradskyella sp. SYSU M77433]|tara:strand:- start:4648 stop:5550 length:903 start_codon:yes stop_codon:yes gene_type:complete